MTNTCFKKFVVKTNAGAENAYREHGSSKNV